MDTVYQTSPQKRARVTKATMTERRKVLLGIVRDGRPMPVRQVSYRATVRNIVEKAESGYAEIQTDLVCMRRSGEMPYDWLADNTRWQRKPRTFSSIQQALAETARFYRKSLWVKTFRYVEVWLEKDALSAVIYPITSNYDVPLMVVRGYSSLSFLATAAEHISNLDVPAYIFHLGDYDPSGVDAGWKIEATLRALAPNATIHFHQLAITPGRLRCGSCQRGRQSRPILGRKVYAIFPSSRTRCSRTCCARWSDNGSRH